MRSNDNASNDCWKGKSEEEWHHGVTAPTQQTVAGRNSTPHWRPHHQIASSRSVKQTSRAFFLAFQSKVLYCCICEVKFIGYLRCGWGQQPDSEQHCIHSSRRGSMLPPPFSSSFSMVSTIPNVIRTLSTTSHSDYPLFLLVWRPEDVAFSRKGSAMVTNHIKKAFCKLPRKKIFQPKMSRCRRLGNG